MYFTIYIIFNFLYHFSHVFFVNHIYFLGEVAIQNVSKLTNVIFNLDLSKLRLLQTRYMLQFN